MMTWTEQTASFITSLKYEDIPLKVVDTVKRALLDTIACMIAGNNEEVTNIVMSMVKEYHNERPISAAFTKERIGPVHAALINGIMSHAIDFDDVNAPTHGHPSTVILPAALAAAELAETNGKEFIAAFVVGVEIMSILGEVLGFSHYQKGWHTTTTLGTLGATVAASRALSLDRNQVTRALSIATSQTAGTRQNFGTMMKPFHAGNAARIGVWSALLAKNGLTSSDAILESRMGYFNLYSGDENINEEFAEQVFNSLGKRFRLLNPGIDVKKYPCCYWTARAADGMLDIAQKESLSVDQIERIEVVAPSGGLDALIYDRPKTGLQGKFSMEYVVSAALIDKKLNLKTFEDGNVNRKEIIDLEEKVVKWEDPSQSVKSGPNAGYVSVKVRLVNGTIIQRKIDKPRGCSEIPLTLEELQEKLEDCIVYGKKEGLESKIIVEKILAIEKVDNIRLWTEYFL